jgi:transglutaminase-like putative cysteine protease
MNRTRVLVLGLSAIAVMLWLAFAKAVPAGDDWLPITPADLALKDNPASPGANAMILYRRSYVDARRASIDGEFDEEYIRIKIFTEAGVKKETNPGLQFWKEESDIRDIRARTIRPDGSVVNFDGKVFEKIVEKTGENSHLAKTFSLPNVEPGCIVEYKYRQEFKPRFLYSQHWVVSGRLFTRDASFSIAPYLPRSSFDPTLYFRTMSLPAGSLPQRQGDGSYSMEVHNVPGVTEESLMPPVRALEARVDFFYRDRGEPLNETTDQYWNRMGKKWSGELDKFSSKKNALEQDLSQIVAAGDTPEIKLQKIYARVQKIRDLSYEPPKTAAEKKAEEIKPDANVEDVLKRNYASARQLNWLFIALARTAGFEAEEVYLVPRNQDVFSPAGQNAGVLTADIVWARADGKEYWLDPAALYYPFGLLPWYETESKGVRVTKQGAEFVQAPAATSSNATVVRAAELELKEDGSAVGKLQFEFKGESAAIRRTSHHRDDETGRRKALQNEIQRVLPAGSTFELINLENWDDTAAALRVEGNATVPGFGSPVGRRILLPIALFRPSFEETFAPEQRVNPIYFNYRFEQLDNIKIHAPAGFKIASLPPRKSINPGASMSYEIAAAQEGDTVEIKRNFTLGEIHFPRDSYDALRSFFGNMKSNDAAQIVLENSAAAKSN